MLIPSPKMIAIRRDSPRRLTPHGGVWSCENRVATSSNRASQPVLVEEALEQVSQVVAPIAAAHALQPGVRAQPMQAQQQASL